MSRHGQGREEIIQAAQTLFARRGIDLVSSREILALAKQRNQSAVQYHFGSRDGLIQATFLERFKKIDERRVEILATPDLVGDTSELPYEHGLDRLLEAIVIPLVDEATTEAGRDYIRFAAQVVQRPGFSVDHLALDPALPGLRRAIRGLGSYVRDLRPALRTLRAHMIFHLVFGTLRSWVDGQLGSVSRVTITREILAVLSDLVDSRAASRSGRPAGRTPRGRRQGREIRTEQDS